MRVLLLIAGLTYLTGCQPVSLTAPPDREASSAAASIAGATVYRVDAARTDIRILVYRAGALASLGHNHVISAQGVSGSVYVQPLLEESSFELTLPVAELRLDDRQARDEEGESFSSQPTEADIEGTRRNMLGTRVLDFPRYPTIGIAGRLASAGTSPMVQFTIRLKERLARSIVPVEIAIQNDVLTIRGSIELSHEELGLEPFSVMMGAIRVADIITLNFAITANRVNHSS